jgi:ATP phosphoribosyltransferase
MAELLKASANKATLQQTLHKLVTQLQLEIHHQEATLHKLEAVAKRERRRQMITPELLSSSTTTTAQEYLKNSLST